MASTSLPDGRRAFVSTLPAGSGERRLALAVVLASVGILLAAAPAFYRELARRMPALARRVVFVTGDLMVREKREWLESIGNPTLSKPFDVNDVRRAVHRVLEAAT